MFSLLLILYLLILYMLFDITIHNVCCTIVVHIIHLYSNCSFHICYLMYLFAVYIVTVVAWCNLNCLTVCKDIKKILVFKMKISRFWRAVCSVTKLITTLVWIRVYFGLLSCQTALRFHVSKFWPLYRSFSYRNLIWAVDSFIFVLRVHGQER